MSLARNRDKLARLVASAVPAPTHRRLPRRATVGRDSSFPMRRIGAEIAPLVPDKVRRDAEGALRNDSRPGRHGDVLVLIARRMGQVAMAVGLVAALAWPARAQQVVDRIVARIGNDIITLSDIQELGRYQQLVQGKEQPRAERLREVIEQWVVQHDATLSGIQPPTPAEVGKALAALEKRFGSPAAFQARLKELGLSEQDTRRMVQRQMFLSRYLDFRFRAEVQVTDGEIKDYYQNTLVPELKREGAPVPPLESVADQIRRVLVERGISVRAKKWLDELRTRWNVQMIGNVPEK